MFKLRIASLTHRAIPTIVAALLATITACASGRSVPTPAPTPQTPTPQSPTVNPPASPAPVAPPVVPAPVPRSGAWSFTYSPGSYTYVFTTNATIAPATDTSARRPAQGSTARATIIISANGDVQVTDPPAPATPVCDATATLILRAKSVITSLPAHMSAGDTWTDSTNTDGCRGSVPATSHVTRNYTVVGDTALGNARAVQIHHTDTINATGEGAEGQHRVLISASGTGYGDIFVDPLTGRLIGTSSTQTTSVSVTTSGRSNRYLQHVTEQVTLSP